jgi:hypothetical protein
LYWIVLSCKLQGSFQELNDLFGLYHRLTALLASEVSNFAARFGHSSSALSM